MTSHIRDHHITVLVETRSSDISQLSDHLFQTHKCFHNTVEFEGRKGQGVAIFVHTSLQDLIHIWKISDNSQAVWLRVSGSVFGVKGMVMLGGAYINPQSATRRQSDIMHTFSVLHLEISEAQAQSSHILLMGDFNAHLDNKPDPFDDQFAQMLESFPQLRQPRCGPHVRSNVAGKCLLAISASIPLIITTGRGKGDRGQPTFYGYNSLAAKTHEPTRTEHLVMSPDLYLQCQDIKVIEDIYLADHRPLTCSFDTHGCLLQNDFRLPRDTQKQRTGFSLVWRQELMQEYVTSLKAAESELSEYQRALEAGDVDSAYNHFVTHILRAAKRAGMTSKHQPRRARLGLPMPPWFDDKCRAYKAQIRHTAKSRLPVTFLKKAYNSYCRLLKRRYKKQQASAIVAMIDKRDVEAYKLMKIPKHCQVTPIPAETWTEHLKCHFTQKVSRVEGCSSSRLPAMLQPLSDQLRSRQVNPSDIAMLPGPGGRYRQCNAASSEPQQTTLTPSTYQIPSASELSSYVHASITRMNADASSGFDSFTTPFIKHAVEKYQDENGREQSKNILHPLLTDLFNLILAEGLLPETWKKTKVIPLYKKEAVLNPKNYRMLAINGCLYRLYANVVRDLLTNWAIAEKKIPDTQFGFCPTRNTNQPLFKLRHVLSVAKEKKKKLFAAFVDLTAAYDSIDRTKLWTHLEEINTPFYLLKAIKGMYDGGMYILIDGDKASDPVTPDKGVKQGCPLSPLLFSLYINDLDRHLDTEVKGAITAMALMKISHCDYADDIVILANSADDLQSQLNRLSAFARSKRLTVNTEKTKVLVFFSADTTTLPTFTYNGAPLELVTEFKYLGILLTRNGKMDAATTQMSRTFMGAIARVRTAGIKYGILNRKHAMLWLFQSFALAAGLYGCQIWATNKLSFSSSSHTEAHIRHTCFLKSLLGVKKTTETHCLLRETGQMPLYFYWFRCVIRFWNNLLSSNNTLLHQMAQADIRLARNKSSWSCQVLTAIQEIPDAQQFAEAVRSCKKVNMDMFEKVLYNHVTAVWRLLDGVTPQEAHSSSRIMRTYHSNFGIPLGTAQECWVAIRKSRKPSLPKYLRLNLPSHLVRALSCLRLSSHKLRVETLRYGQRRPYELRICDKCDWHAVQDEEHMIFDCENEALISLRVQHQELFKDAEENSASRLRDFVHQDDVFGVAAFVFQCLKCHS